MTDRANIFDDEDEPIRPSPQEILALAQASNFPSREVRAEPVRYKRTPRIHRTGRTAILTVKITPDAYDRFYALADKKGWLVGETFERAVEALEKENQ